VLTLYTTGAPNGRKITIFCAEAELPYTLKLVDLYKSENRHPDFLKINPNGRIPVIVDPDVEGAPVTLWESGAILQYLAEKTGKLLPKAGAERYEVLKWLFFQVTHAPYWGQAHIFRLFTREPIPFAIKRYTRESARLYKLIDDQLAKNEWLAGASYSIADVAMFPWVEYADWQGQTLADYPNVKRWFDMMAERPGVAAGRVIPWGRYEYGPSEEGKAVSVMVKDHLANPAFDLR
jgi:GST-like protein